MTYQYQSGASPSDTDKISLSTWVYVSSDAAAAARSDPHGPLLPLFEFGPSSDVKPGRWVWSAWPTSGNLTSFVTDPAPAIPAVCNRCSPQTVNRNTLTGWTGDMTFPNVDLFSTTLESATGIHNGLTSDAHHSALAWTPFFWTPDHSLILMDDGVTTFPACEIGCTWNNGSPGNSVNGPNVPPGQWAAGEFVTSTFQGNSYADIPSTLLLDPTNNTVYFETGTASTNNPNNTANPQGGDFFGSLPSVFVLDSWNQIIFSLDLSTNPWTWFMIVNGVDQTDHSGDPNNFFDYQMLVNGKQIGIPLIPDEIGRWNTAGPNQQVIYAYTQVWFGQAIDLSDPANLAKFFKLDASMTRIIPPSNLSAAQNEFGRSDIYFYRDKLAQVPWTRNNGTAGAFSIVGTAPADYTPGPGQGPFADVFAIPQPRRLIIPNLPDLLPERHDRLGQDAWRRPTRSRGKAIGKVFKLGSSK